MCKSASSVSCSIRGHICRHLKHKPYQRLTLEVVGDRNLNLKEVLGLSDFRLQFVEAIQKWFAVVTLAIN